MISSGVFPFLCSVITLLFMNTVHRLPRTAGSSDAKTALAIPRAGMFRDAAKFSRNEPHPEEHASLTTIFVMTPWSTQIAFISCPPISRMKLTPSTYFAAARVWATVSTTWHSVSKAFANSSSPYPVVPAAMIFSRAPASSYRFFTSSSAFFATDRGFPSLEA